ncbi:unnamed protein product [Didymodactylos carnosus]|uniref:Aminopeptidase N n=1 Tax=Didymodactylos carnosus TaxID=1234261 RepID=A0A8S2NXH2_9BILA|nr:unnamed protein product [Didymodactylos carnosus]CAF4022826.1 unnamed protein product [Didymodactylos carnosus]
MSTYRYEIPSSEQETTNTLQGLKISTKWIILGAVFYVASLVIVGLIVGLVPKRAQQITIIETAQTDKLSTIDSQTSTVSMFHQSCNITNFQCSISSLYDERLSKAILPLHYELEYRIENMTQTTFKGSVKMHFQLKQRLKRLVYHAKRMTKLCPPLLQQGDVTMNVNMSLCLENESVILEDNSGKSFPENDGKTKYILYQEFESKLNDGNVGFYQSEFKDINGNRKLLATKFQPTDARKAFPCFDEPKLKATFKIAIVHPTNTTALSNFPVESIKQEDADLMRTTFQETFKMSTYLAAWAIVPADFGVKSIEHENITLRVWARKGPTDKNQTLFALNIAREAMIYFGEYFNTTDSLPPQIGKWLNEAMATWLSYKPLVKNHPEWHMDLQALTEDVIGVMWDDAKPSSHPISVHNVSTAGHITSLFDSITYSKGASILRMLEKIVGENEFRDGLRTYLKQNAFDVGNPDDFYNNLTFPNPLTGKEFMNNWLEELNFPLLNVHMTLTSSGTVLNFTQSGNHANQNHTVDIEPLNPFYLDSSQLSVTIKDKYFTWIKCNKNFTGFYVTSYNYTQNDTVTNASSNLIWKHFESVLLDAPKVFSNEDKTNLIHDAFLLSYNGIIEYEIPLRIVKTLRITNNKEYVPWKTFAWHWDNLADVMMHRENSDIFRVNIYLSYLLK